ncbi:ComF family protein [Candidatus Woesearchaeota archaeon]|nr:ComF family protein [Candidatus Woesearchaeota archaeon]
MIIPSSPKRPEERTERGCIRSIIQDDFYPGLEVQGVSPRHYFKQHYHQWDEYSKRILYAKEKSRDESDFFKPYVESCINNFKVEMMLSKIDWITPIPNSHNWYYPTMIGVANIISAQLGKPKPGMLFQRIRGPISTDRGREERYKALHGKFICHPTIPQGKSILLVDDIRTSGISVLECAEVLFKGGAKAVTAFALGTNTSNPPIVRAP